MGTTKNTTMEPYNVQYYIAKYGTVENLTKDYEGAIGYLRMQYKQYEDNPHKGGRYRREKMKRIKEQAEAIFDELLRVSRAMKEYLTAQATETPQISTQTAETVNVSAEGKKERITRYAGYVLTDCKNKQYVGEVELPNGLTLKFKYVYNLNGKDMYTVEDWQNGKLQCSVSHESRERILDYIADIIDPIEPPQSPEVPQMAECTAEPCKLAQTA